MSWLKLNNYAVPVRQTNPTHGRTAMGGSGKRAFDGTYRKTARNYKRNWMGLETRPVTETEALALRGLLDGEGHSWSFEDSSDFLYSSKGKATASGTATRTGTGGKHGAYITIAAGAAVTWDVELDGSWTLMVWKDVSSTWKHYILDSAGNKYEDGATYGSSIPFLGVSGGVATLGDTGAGGNQLFDDFVALPFLITAGMASAFATSSARFSSLPKLSATGDFIPDASLSVFGAGVELTYTPVVLGGSFDTSAYTVRFGLEEE